MPLESIEQAATATACTAPLCSAVCSCTTSCATSCCTSATVRGVLTTCSALSSAKCSGKLNCTCGNGVCDGSESTTNCEKDCPECQTAGADPTGCGYSCGKPGAAEDRDADGIPDQLEYLLAHKFFPNMWVKWDVSDKQQFYANAPKTTTVPYSARLPIFSNTGPCSAAPNLCIQITYGMAYERDCGDNPDGACAGGLLSGAHLGDSEFYIAILKRTAAWDVARSKPGSWQLIADFTSAHFGTDPPICSSDGSKIVRYGGILKDCFSLYGYNASGCLADSDCRMNYMSTPHCEGYCSGPPAVSTAPLATRTTLYVSEGKHAQYHGFNECNGGGACGADRCWADAAINLRSGKSCYNLQNVGNVNNHTAFRTTIRRPGGGTYEMWGTDKFGDATSYNRPFNSTLALCMMP